MAIYPPYGWAVVGGYGSHLWIDMLNIRGVDLFWPSPLRVVTPGNRNWRFQAIAWGMTSNWTENVHKQLGTVSSIG